MNNFESLLDDVRTDLTARGYRPTFVEAIVSVLSSDKTMEALAIAMAEEFLMTCGSLKEFEERLKGVTR